MKSSKATGVIDAVRKKKEYWNKKIVWLRNCSVTLNAQDQV